MEYKNCLKQTMKYCGGHDCGILETANPKKKNHPNRKKIRPKPKTSLTLKIGKPQSYIG